MTNTEVDWTYQWQHESSDKYTVKPKFNIGDVAMYDDEKVTIKNVRQKTRDTFTYDLEEYPHTFVFDFELKEIADENTYLTN